MKKNKIIYWIATGLFLFLMGAGAVNYIINHETVTGVFEGLGFPAWIVYPLAIAKLLGVVAIVTRKSQVLKEWAYAGFFYDAVLAIGAHVAAGDNEYLGAVIATVLIIVSRVMEERAFPAE
ncbi:MAG: DoxX family protein [Bacteroidota bacterium]